MFYQGMVIGAIIGVVITFFGLLILVGIAAYVKNKEPKQNVEIRVGGEPFPPETKEEETTRKEKPIND